MWPLRGSPSAEKDIAGKGAAALEGKRSYDIANAMEMGLARENTRDFMTPLKKWNRLFKFDVKRSADERHYRLYCDDGEFLMYARFAQDRRRVDVFLYDPLDIRQSILFDPDKPAFSMTINESNSEWRLVKEKRDDYECMRTHMACGCQGRQEVACIRQTQQDVGDGSSYNMDIDLAPMHGEACGRHLVTKMPVWSAEVDSLVLDFKGRHAQASSKNFQLVQQEGSRHVVCQYCELGTNSFSLDFKFPLTVIQAFGIALSTLFWT